MKTNKKFKGIVENKVNMGMFDFSVIFITGDYEMALDYVKWKFDNKTQNLEDFDMGYEPLGKCFFLAGYIPIVWLPKKPNTKREHAIYAHECLHAVFHLFEWASLPITRDTEEVMTHALAHLITNGIK